MSRTTTNKIIDSYSLFFFKTYEQINEVANGFKLSSRSTKLLAASDLSWSGIFCVANGVSFAHVSNNFCIFLLDLRVSPPLENINFTKTKIFDSRFYFIINWFWVVGISCGIIKYVFIPNFAI